MSARREQLEAMLAEDPSDVFLRYGLAMEWQKEGQADRSLDGFRELMADDPPYVPAFFMAGKLLAELGDVEKASGVLREGIEQARAVGNQHAASEMSEFLISLGDL